MTVAFGGRVAGDTSAGPSRSTFPVFLGGGFIIAVIVLLTGWAILNGRADAHRAAEVANANFSQALADNFNSLIKQIDLGLLAVQDELSRQQRRGDLDGEEIAGALARQDERNPATLGYRIFGSDGRLRYGVKNIVNRDADISQRDEFKYLRDHGDSGLVVSAPLMGMTTGQWVIVLERMISDPDGSFGGVVSAAIPNKELQTIFASLRIGANGVALLAHSNHKIAAWVPVSPGMKDPIGTEGISENLRALMDSGVQAAQYDAVSPVDGVNRAVHVRKIAGHPYYILVALAEDDYLGNWRRDSVKLLTFGVFMVGLTLAGKGMAYRRTCERERAARVVEREKLRLQTILRTASDGIHILDGEGLLIEANDAFLNMLGYDGSAIGKLRVSDWDVGHSWGELKQRLDDFTARQGHEIFETRHRCRGGSIIDVEVSCRWIEIDGKKFIYSASRDITQRKVAAMELRRFKAIVESSGDAIIGKTLDGVVTNWNHAAEEMFGYTAEEAVGNSLMKLIPVERQQEEADILARISQGEKIEHFETVRCRKDGSLIDISTTISPIQDEDGKVIGVSKIARDITERKAMELALKQTNAELEQFAYVASHDLRQPLRMVTNYLGLIEKRLGSQISEELKAYFGFAVSGARRMDLLIADLLQYSRTGKSAETVPVSLGPAVDDARHNLSMMIDEAGATITVQDQMPTIMGNQGEAVRLFQNLINNAIKYCSPDRQPVVDIGWRRQDHDYLVWIKDNGIGIAPEDCDKAFQIFQRFVPKDAYEGSGIGLAVCKKIVEHCGGKIWIDSKVGVGSTFFMMFPGG